MNFCSLCGSLPCTCHDELGLLDNKNRSDLGVNGKAWSMTDTIIDEGSNNEGNLQGKEFKHVSYDLSVLNFTDQNARGGSQSSDEEIVVGVEVQYQDSSESRDKSSDNNTAFLSFFGWKEKDEVEDDDKQIIKCKTKTKSVGGKTFVDMEEGGNGDDDKDADVPDSDVAKAKMKATQDIMRNTTLNQAEKPALIRRVQAVSADRDLGNGAKVRQMQQLAEGKMLSADELSLLRREQEEPAPRPKAKRPASAAVGSGSSRCVEK